MRLHCVFETADGCVAQEVFEAKTIPMQIKRPCKGWRKWEVKKHWNAKEGEAGAGTGSVIPDRLYEFTRSDAGTFYYREVLR